MNQFFAAFLVFVSVHAFAAESSEGTSRSSFEDLFQGHREAPNWKFLLGQSNLSARNTDNYNPGTDSGSGLNVGVERRLNNLFSLGVGFSQINSTFPNGTGAAGDYTYQVFSTYASLTPIRYEVGLVDFAGSIEAGAIFSGAQGTEAFYGGALTFSFNKQVGLSIESKVAQNIKFLNSVSIVGYY